MYRATASPIGGTPNKGRTFKDAETAARHLLILLRAAGYTLDRDRTVSTLAGGETVQFANFEYRVTREP